jgi:hypothetical protein
MAGQRKAHGSSALHFDAITALIETGLTLQAACASNPDFPSASAISALCARSEIHRTRFDEAVRVGNAKGRDSWRLTYTEMQYDLALEAIRTGSGSLKSILKPPLPTYKAVIQRCDRDPAFKLRYRAAMATHQNPLHLKPEAFTEALDLINANPNVSVPKLLKRAGLPSRQTLDDKISRDASFAALARSIALKRKRVRSHAQKMLRTKPVYSENTLMGALRLNQYYAVANRAVPRNLDHADREDVISELILVMVGGSMSLEEAERTGTSFAREYLNQQRRHLFSSLDVSRYDTEGWVERLSADEWAAA